MSPKPKKSTEQEPVTSDDLRPVPSQAEGDEETVDEALRKQDPPQTRPPNPKPNQ
jgi:hypothetical protein